MTATTETALAARMRADKPPQAFVFTAGPVTFGKATPAAGRAKFAAGDLVGEARRAVADLEDDVRRATERLTRARELLRDIESKTSAAAGFTAAAPLLPPPFARKPAGITVDDIAKFQASRPGTSPIQAFEALFARSLPLPASFAVAGAPAR